MREAFWQTIFRVLVAEEGAPGRRGRREGGKAGQLGKTQIIEFLSTELNYVCPKRRATLKPFKVAGIMHFKLRIIKINATNDLNLL